MKVFNMQRFLSKLDNFLKIPFILAIFSYIIVLTHKALIDLDIWLHLKTGEIIVQNKAVPWQDIFSFTLNAKRWVDHEWLFQVIVYLVNTNWQADGIIFMQSFIISMAFLVVFFIAYKSTGSYFVSSLLLILALNSLVSRINIRPEIFSLLLFSLYLYILFFCGRRKWLWLLLPLQVLWVNLHGFFFLGPLLVLFFCLGEIPLGKNQKDAFTPEQYLRLIVVLLALLAASLINPNGLEGAFYPIDILWDTLLGKNKIIFSNIEELQPVFYLMGNFGKFIALYGIGLVCLAAMLCNFKRLRPAHLLIFIFFLIFSFRVRNIAFFSFSACAIAAVNIMPALNSIKRFFSPGQPLKKPAYFFIKYASMAIIVFWIVTKITSYFNYSEYSFEDKKNKSPLLGISEESYPKKAVEFLLANNLGPDIINDFNSGSYIIGSAYPKLKVFIDGRTELYGEEFLNRYFDMLKGDAAIFEGMSDKYNVSAVLLSMTLSPLPKLAYLLYSHPQWKLVYFDDKAIIFLKDIKANQEVIKKYAVDLKKYKSPDLNSVSLGIRKIFPLPFIKRARLFILLREYDAAISEALAAQGIMPDCPEAYQILGRAYLRKGNYQEAFKNFRIACLLSPGDPEMLVDLGTSLKELKEYQFAIRALNGAIRINEKYAPAYFELGRAYLINGQYLKAIEAFGKAVKYNPKSTRYRQKLEVAQRMFSPKVIINKLAQNKEIIIDN